MFSKDYQTTVLNYKLISQIVTTMLVMSKVRQEPFPPCEYFRSPELFNIVNWDKI